MLERLDKESVHDLLRAIVSVKNEQECFDFLYDLCTVAEIKAMAQRLEVAQMLEEHVVYSEIVKKTGASTATISRVNRALNYGSNGYKMVLEALNTLEGK